MGECESVKLTNEERAELADIRARKLAGMPGATWRRYVELRQKERGEDERD